MKPSLLRLLECPECDSGYDLTIEERAGAEIIRGTLRCRCGAFPVVGGVPRLIEAARGDENWRTAERFGGEWNQFPALADEYEAQFLSWIEPVTRDHFQGKTVLDVGCGKGRHVYWAKKFGAKEVVGIDLSHAVDAAFRNVGRMDGVHIIQADIYRLPLKPAFDYAYSIGVLHHTPDPARSFHCMVEEVRSGGSVSAWVYGREGNDWIVRLINPIRRVTSILPLSITKALAFMLATILQAALKLIYAPACCRPALKRLLPYSDYLCSIAGYAFRENYSIVFDHLLPGIAHYILKDEFEGWFRDNRLERVVITPRYGNSWRGFGYKP